MKPLQPGQQLMERIEELEAKVTRLHAELAEARDQQISAVNSMLKAERKLAAVRHHLEAAYEAMGVPLIMSRPLSCYINDLRKELAAERAARIAVASPVRQEGEP